MEQEKTPTILVTTDFTEISQFAIDHAATFAKIFSAKVLILHVMDKYTRKMLGKEGKSEDYANTLLEQKAEEVKRKFGVEAYPMLENGRLFHVIGRVADESGAVVHFLATHGKKGIQWISGSFALKVVKRSPVPVMIVQKPVENIDYKRIVYPLDLQVGSKQKVKWARILNETAGSHYEILVDSYNDESTNRKLRADLKQVSNILDQSNIPYSVSFANSKGSFANQIIEFARTTNADAIMVTSDPDKLTWNPFNKEEERVLYNKEKIPVMFINSKNLKLVIGGV